MLEMYAEKPRLIPVNFTYYVVKLVALNVLVVFGPRRNRPQITTGVDFKIRGRLRKTPYEMLNFH